MLQSNEIFKYVKRESTGAYINTNKRKIIYIITLL